MSHLLPLFAKSILMLASIFFCIGLCCFAFYGSILCFIPAVAILYLGLLFYDFKSAYLLLIAAVPLSIHVGFETIGLSLSVPAEPMLWLLYVSSILLLIAQAKNLPKWFWGNRISIIIFLQLLWLIVAVCYSEVPVLSVKFLFSKTWYLIGFFFMPIWFLKEKKDFTKLFLCLLIPLLLYITIILIRHSFYDFQFYYIDAAVGNLFYKHVDYASVISMFFPFVLVSYFIAQQKTVKKLLLVLILIFLIAVVLSYTRAAMGGIVFGMLIVFAIRIRLVNWMMPSFYTIVICVFLYFAQDNKFLKYHPHFNETYMHHEFGDHLKATIEGKDMSSVERLYRWIAAVRMGADRPITGFGPHSFYYYYKPYTLSAYRTYVSENYEQSTTHNYFLYMLVEQGAPAMVLYALLMIVVFARIQKIYHQFADTFYKWLCLAIAMSLAICFVNNLFSELIETDKIGPLFYLNLSMIVILDYKSNQPIG